nr:wall-associated receptor kinase-like 20 [Quercus suber]
MGAGTHVSEAYNTCPKCGSIDVPYPLSTDDNCGDPSSEGLKLDENLPFNISTHNTVMLFNCSDHILFSPLNCSSTSFCRQFEDNVEEGIGCKNTLCCHYLKDSAMTSHMIRIRAVGCTAYTSMVNMKPGSSFDSWTYGIELQWVPPN